jgi:hypothetical protein
MIENPTIKLPEEPALDGVSEEDRRTVRNVIYVVHALKLCISWSVAAKNQGYEITGIINNNTNTEIHQRDMEAIRCVDPLRVNSISTRVLGGVNPTFTLVVHVLRKSEPVVLEEQDVIQIRRKRRFWSGGSD